MRTNRPRTPTAPLPEEPVRPVRSAAARARGATQALQAKRETSVSAPNTEEHQEEILYTDEFPPNVEPAMVRVAMGKTISLGAGSYEFLRIDVSVTLPCRPSQINQTHQMASEFVAEKLLDEEGSWLGYGNVPAPKQTAKRRG